MEVDELTMEVDLLVLGGGMAGMTAAALAAGRGLSVGVVEKGPEIGGSAVLSGGGMIKPASPETLIAANPGGDPLFAHLLYDNYDKVIGWLASLDINITEPADVEEVVGIAATVRGIDIIRFIELARLEVQSAGGWVVTDTDVLSLDRKNGAVIGATVRDRDGTTVIRALATVLATGGFQGSPELRERFLGKAAAGMLVRANSHSAGDGLRLALAAGAAHTPKMDRFYGHTVPAPLHTPFEPKDFVRLSMPFMVTRSVLLDRDGHRFVDESAGYYVDAQAVLHQPDARALLIGDQKLRDEDNAGCVTNRTLGFELVDRPVEAARAGARVCEADTVEELEETVAAWGYRGVSNALSEYNRHVTSVEAMYPPRIRNRRPLMPPFFAIEVQPAITFTFGGLAVNGDMAILNSDGAPIAGLYAAGADIGGAFCEQYASGLSLAAVTAWRAVTSLSSVLNDGCPTDDPMPIASPT